MHFKKGGKVKTFKLVLLVLVILAFGFCLSCSKKAVRTEAVSYPSQKTTDAAAEEEAKAAAEKAAAMEAEKKLQEETLKEEAARTESEKIRQQELQGKAMQEEAARKEAAAREAAEREKNLTLEPIYFDFDDYAIRDDQKEVLTKNADWFKVHAQVRIRLEGNCDERGTAEYNLALGQRRADSTKAFLEGLGIQKNRMLTISYGKERPIALEHNEAAWAKNRRVDFAPLK